MTPKDFQRWLNDRGCELVADGNIGPVSKGALLSLFSNPSPAKVTEKQIEEFARRLGCTVRQLKAVAAVESGGSAFDRSGRPKMLFERHVFHRLTRGWYGRHSFSDPKPGGYSVNSWAKLADAAARDPDAAFQSASWGRFQILGSNARALEYPSALEMAYSAVSGEAAHYQMLVRFIAYRKMNAALARLSSRAVDNREFASLYNGAGYRVHRYDARLAEAMARV